jgi:two-component system sensor histidine kinase TctE
MSAARPGSLRNGILLWLLLPLVVGVGASTVMSYRGALAAADVAYDRTLLASTRSIAERVVSAEDRVRVALPYAAIDVFESDSPGRLYYKVAGLHGELLAGYEDFPPTPAGTPRSDLYPALVHFYNARYRGRPLRAATLYHPVSGPAGRGIVVIQVGETLEVREAFARGVLVQTLVQQGLLVVLVAAATLLALARALRPVGRLRREVAGRAPADLTPVAEDHVHRELRPLVGALNEHIERVRRLLESRRRFIADASHQLRTPLAALKTQAEVALRAGSLEGAREVVRAIHATTDETVRLTNQLLVLARAEPESGASALGRTDLEAVARQVCLDRSPEAVRREIDLAFEGEAAEVRGDAVLLRELVANLVDNALCYGGGGGAVTVRVRSGGGEAVLEVEDGGRGIPAGLRARVFERFYRLAGEATPGTGLGLAIVKEIATRHGAVVSLEDGRPGAEPPGLRVRVTFPGPAPAPGPAGGGGG